MGRGAFFSFNANDPIGFYEGYDLIVCGADWDTAPIRAKYPEAKLAGYLNMEAIVHPPHGPVTTALHEALLPFTFVRSIRDNPLREGDGWVSYAPTVQGEARRCFSPDPWPKGRNQKGRDKLLLKMTYKRVQEHIAAYLNAVADAEHDYDLHYIDQCRPWPDRYFSRMKDAGLEAQWRDDTWNELVTTYFVQQFREVTDIPLIGNTAGWTCKYLDAIAIEDPTPEDMKSFRGYADAQHSDRPASNIAWGRSTAFPQFNVMPGTRRSDLP